MGNILANIFYFPILNLLVWFYNIIPGQNIVFAITALTIVSRLALYPLFKKSVQSQKAMQQLQPKINDLKTKHGDNKETMGKELMDLYKQEKINPMSSCLPLLIQLPFLWAIFSVFRNGLSNKVLTGLYPFITNPGIINPVVFGWFDLSKPNIVLAVLAAGAQFLQTRLMPQPPKSADKKLDAAAMMSKQMMFLMPVMTLFICLSLPSGLTFYWFLSTLLMVGQQWWVYRNDKPSATKVIEAEVVQK